MQLEAKKYLFDIRVACDRVTRFCLGKRFDDYAADDMLRSAVERQLAITGEAMGQLAKTAPSIAQKITAHRRSLVSATSSCTVMPRWMTSSCGAS
jgi:uncharacterized protein with HEPN domain